jgi:hypothetical protein
MGLAQFAVFPLFRTIFWAALSVFPVGFSIFCFLLQFSVFIFSSLF